MNEATMTPPDAQQDPLEITKQSGSNFLAGFVCLDARRRHGMTVVYAFCRVVDDAVDEAPDVETARGRLAFWRRELGACDGGQPATPVGVALKAAVEEFSIPIGALEDLIAGCAMDLNPDGIADGEELELYCYRVASAVGLACLPVLGATSAGAKKFAAALGHALQSTNVLRDLRGDAEIERYYAPKTWLVEFGITVEDLLGTGEAKHYAAGGGVTLLCQRLAGIGREQFAVARAELRRLPLRERRALVAPRIMGAIYGELLRRLERRGGAIAGPRMRVPRGRKLWLAASVWLGARA
ncbi:MAG: phytoene synthase [Planctomycetota bacterium]|jgi:phytoene synthase